MNKVYKTREEAVAAFKKTVTAREVWENAISQNASKEEIEKMGLKTVGIYDK